jgi:ribosome-associated protein
LRALIRQARKDAQATQAQEAPGVAVRHGKAYRDIFQLVKEVLNRGNADDSTDDPSADTEQP